MWPAHDTEQIRRFAEGLAPRLGLIGPVIAEPWKEGASNAVWRMDAGNWQGVLKVGKLEDWRRLAVEASVLRAIDGCGAPKFVDGGPAGDELPWDWSVLERIEGEHPYGFDADAAAAVGKTIERLRAVDHGSLLSRQSVAEFIEDRIRHPLGSAISAPVALKDRFEEILATVAGRSDLADALDASASGIVHGDLIPLNLLAKPDGSMWVLDWENPRLGSAAWDLAGLRKAFRLAPGAWDALVRTVGEDVSMETIDFADALQQLQVAAWRAETWWGRGVRSAGEWFLIELGQELETARSLLRRLSR